MGKWLEHILPILIGVIIALILQKFDIVNYKNSIDIMKSFPTIGVCFFGFLLTMFSLIIQGNNKTTEVMRSDKKLFKKFVALNCNVVLLSLIVTIYSYFIGNIKLVCCQALVYMDIATTVFYALFIAFVLANIYFLAVFYLLVLINNKDDKKND